MPSVAPTLDHHSQLSIAPGSISDPISCELLISYLDISVAQHFLLLVVLNGKFTLGLAQLVGHAVRLGLREGACDDQDHDNTEQDGHRYDNRSDILEDAMGVAPLADR
mmetsp:Transcript_62610/g.123698  ORF Transcript_62610/g.123698 Transcript_62610/m.123698 type:complete len:108 (-) Transcript_62610:2841-3164(-)